MYCSFSARSLEFFGTVSTASHFAAHPRLSPSFRQLTHSSLVRQRIDSVRRALLSVLSTAVGWRRGSECASNIRVHNSDAASMSSSGDAVGGSNSSSALSASDVLQFALPTAHPLRNYGASATHSPNKYVRLSCSVPLPLSSDF